MGVIQSSINQGLQSIAQLGSLKNIAKGQQETKEATLKAAEASSLQAGLQAAIEAEKSPKKNQYKVGGVKMEAEKTQKELNEAQTASVAGNVEDYFSTFFKKDLVDSARQWALKRVADYQKALQSQKNDVIKLKETLETINKVKAFQKKGDK